MSAKYDLERRIADHYAAEAPNRAPDWVLERVAASVATTSQRWTLLRRPRRIQRPSGSARLALSAAAGVAVVVLATVLALDLVPVIGPGLPSPSPSTTTQPASRMWPQTSLEEVRQAQELADAGDPTYAWQLRVDGGQVGQHHPCPGATSGCWNPAKNTGSGEIFIRFLEEELGWEAFAWDEAFAHFDGIGDGVVVFVRCAPGGINPLYATEPDGAGCAPTIDELRYETVHISVAQLVRGGESGIWVVTGWAMAEPVAQIAPPANAEIAAFLEPFLQARIDGAGADDFAKFPQDDEDPDLAVQPIPLLYATTTGLSFGRWEFAIVDGPVWPKGRIQLEVRLFAKNDDALVEQAFSLDRDASGRLRLVYEPVLTGPDGPISGTTENGAAVPVEHAFLNGEVTFRAAYPLEPSDYVPDRLSIDGLLPGDDAPRRILDFLVNPQPVGSGCVDAPAPADAEALARSITSDPRFDGTALAVTIGGLPALQMDGVGAQETACGIFLQPVPSAGRGNARLYLVDLPGGSARVLAIAISGDDDSFETLLGWATPVVDSIEFHTP